MSVNINEIKIELIQRLIATDDSTTLKKVIELMDNKDYATSKAEELSLEKGLTDAESGSLKPNSEAQKIYEKWL